MARRLDLADGPLLLLEPRTEGRLAAALARHGEGPVAIYLAAADGPWTWAALGPWRTRGACWHPRVTPWAGGVGSSRPSTRGGPSSSTISR